jgi:hypothetical protein
MNSQTGSEIRVPRLAKKGVARAQCIQTQCIGDSDFPQPGSPSAMHRGSERHRLCIMIEQDAVQIDLRFPNRQMRHGLHQFVD